MRFHVGEITTILRKADKGFFALCCAPTKAGQTLVEFAIIIPILLLLVMGAFDFGRVMYIKISLNSIAREGAYHLAYYPSHVIGCSGVGMNTTCLPGTETWNSIVQEANNLGVTINTSNVRIIGTRAQATPVEVRITQTVDLQIFNFITGPITVNSSVRMMVQ
jgi:Flp pilus assembly protein TadG